MCLDERKFRILQAIIDDYILTAVPVGSRTLSRKQGMDLSSATIRNEMSDLEELGYLASPHTSAGRIPSLKAYRLYVDQILRVSRLPTGEYSSLQEIFSKRMGQMEDVLSCATQALSELTTYTSIVAAPKVEVIRHLQLVPLTESSALLVTVTDAGVHKDSVIRIPQGVTAEHLHMLSGLLTTQLSGLSMSEVPSALHGFSREMSAHRTSFSELIGNLQTQMESGHTTLHMAGASRLLAHPEYNDVQRARNLISTLEAREKIAKLLTQHKGLEFSIAIGPELAVREMEDCSLVTVSYHMGGSVGTMGVIGPTRMNYARVVSVMDAMRHVMSEMVDQT